MLELRWLWRPSSVVHCTMKSCRLHSTTCLMRTSSPFSSVENPSWAKVILVTKEEEVTGKKAAKRTRPVKAVSLLRKMNQARPVSQVSAKRMRSALPPVAATMETEVGPLKKSPIRLPSPPEREELTSSLRPRSVRRQATPETPTLEAMETEKDLMRRLKKTRRTKKRMRKLLLRSNEGSAMLPSMSLGKLTAKPIFTGEQQALT